MPQRGRGPTPEAGEPMVQLVKPYAARCCHSSAGRASAVRRPPCDDHRDRRRRGLGCPGRNARSSLLTRQSGPLRTSGRLHRHRGIRTTTAGCGVDPSGLPDPCRHAALRARTRRPPSLLGLRPDLLPRSAWSGPSEAHRRDTGRVPGPRGSCLSTAGHRLTRARGWCTAATCRNQAAGRAGYATTLQRLTGAKTEGRRSASCGR
jgi:hypothetical protein